MAAHLSHHCCCGAVTATHQVMVAEAAVARGECGETTGNGKKRGGGCAFMCRQMTNNESRRQKDVSTVRGTRIDELFSYLSSPHPSLQWKIVESSSSLIHVRFY